MKNQFCEHDNITKSCVACKQVRFFKGRIRDLETKLDHAKIANLGLQYQLKERQCD